MKRPSDKLPPECDEYCPYRKCYAPGFDKGSFTPGRGYTSYHKVPRPCCMTRLTKGCPSYGIGQGSIGLLRPMPDWNTLLATLGDAIGSLKMSARARDAANRALAAAILAAAYARMADRDHQTN